MLLLADPSNERRKKMVGGVVRFPPFCVRNKKWRESVVILNLIRPISNYNCILGSSFFMFLLHFQSLGGLCVWEFIAQSSVVGHSTLWEVLHSLPSSRSGEEEWEEHLLLRLLHQHLPSLPGSSPVPSPPPGLRLFSLLSLLCSSTIFLSFFLRFFGRILSLCRAFPVFCTTGSPVRLPRCYSAGRFGETHRLRLCSGWFLAEIWPPFLRVVITILFCVLPLACKFSLVDEGFKPNWSFFLVLFPAFR